MAELCRARASLRISALGLLCCAAASLCMFLFPATHAKEQLNPAAWGENHAGQPLPQLEEGSQCLFCHRATVGVTWGSDRHNKTVRLLEESPEGAEKLRGAGADSALFDEILYVLGHNRQHAFLKPGEAYGTADLLSVRYDVHGKNLHPPDAKPAWQKNTFNESCAGCHATGYDTTTRDFQAITLDCVVCHGQLPISHTEDPRHALFNIVERPDPRVEMSVCGSCHIRDGKSRSTGRPHADNYLPGDNLFQDLKVDWSDGAMEKLNPADRHVMLNIRDVVLYGKEEMTCTTCHGVHKQTTLRHRKLPDTPYCFICHTGEDTKSGTLAYTVHSGTCGY